MIKRKEEVKSIASSCAPQDIPNILQGTAWIHLSGWGDQCMFNSNKMNLHKNERGVYAYIYVCMFTDLCIYIKLIN